LSKDYPIHAQFSTGITRSFITYDFFFTNRFNSYPSFLFKKWQRGVDNDLSGEEDIRVFDDRKRKTL
jgi:hypothetical protein